MDSSSDPVVPVDVPRRSAAAVAMDAQGRSPRGAQVLMRGAVAEPAEGDPMAAMAAAKQSVKLVEALLATHQRDGRLTRKAA